MPGTADKLVWKPGTLLAPVPAVLVSCCKPDGTSPNLITLAWAGTVCSDPPTVAIGVRPERHSHPLILDTGEFVVNLPDEAHAKAVDFCGVRSGRDLDKWAETGLTPRPAATVRPPLVDECPVALECRVTDARALGSHTMILGEVLAVRVNPDLVDGQGRLALDRAGLFAFVHGEYFALGKKLGFFGWSVAKRAKAKARVKTTRAAKARPKANE